MLELVVGDPEPVGVKAELAALGEHLAEEQAQRGVRLLARIRGDAGLAALLEVAVDSLEAASACEAGAYVGRAPAARAVRE